MVQKKIISKAQAARIISHNKTIFVTGSFDLVHLGHLRFLHKAKKKGGKGSLLIVALLNDTAVKQRKGTLRPIFNEQYRLEFLSHIAAVDYIFLWQDPWEELRKFVLQIKPKYLAVVTGDSGLDNKKKIIEQAKGELIVIPKQGSFSSSQIINNILRKYS